MTRETYGVLIYQEQVMQAAQVLAGFTLGAADLLRRAMGKKKVEEMAKQRETFVKGCAKVNNIPAPKANQIFDLLEKFAGYGFNKSHAAAYAIVAYQTAWLKANYPVEFFSAMMTNDLNDMGKLSILIAEAKHFWHRGSAARCQSKRGVFHPQPGGAEGARWPSGSGWRRSRALDRWRSRACWRRARRENSNRWPNYASGWTGRTVNRKVLEALIKSGACDCFGENRATLFSKIDRVLTRAASIIHDRQRGQDTMFGMMEERGRKSPSRKNNCPNGRSTNCWPTSANCWVFM